jgi:hypothetical protein
MEVGKRKGFESGIFWELYLDLERQFQSFLEFVPYMKGNEKTFSFKLQNLILSIGGYVDSAFKEMAFYRGRLYDDKSLTEIRALTEKKRIVSVTLPLIAFEKKYKLSMKTVTFKRLPGREDITPFKSPGTPEWWKLYNKLKHDVGLNLKQANLRNTRDALAGAFLLNVVHTPSALRLNEYNLIRLATRTRTGRITGEYGSAKPQNLEAALEWGTGIVGAYVETPVFYYDYTYSHT